MPSGRRLGNGVGGPGSRSAALCGQREACGQRARGTCGPASAARVEEAQPPLYYLKDNKGNLQAVPNFTLEDFEALYKLKHQLVQGDQRPRFSLQQMIANGAVNAAGQAELTIQFRILVRDDQWTRIPLRLDHAVLCETPQYQGPGEHLVSFEGDGEGYVAWIRGPAGQQHQLTLKMLVPTTAAGQETHLRLSAPRATVAELKLKVPFARAVARVSEGATLQSPGGNNQETELAVVGLSGDFELSWRPPDAAATRSAALEVYGTIASQLNGHGVETDATFSIRSYGEAFDRFLVRLPPDTELAPSSPNGYTLTAVDDPAAAAQGRRPCVEVKFAKRTVGPVEVRLSTKRTDRGGAGTAARGVNWLELGGFEVLEAARQWGIITVNVAGDHQILWGECRGVRQIDPSPDAQGRSDVTAEFEYFAQPASLLARVVPRKTRIGVEPEYVVLVDANRVRLEARLRYTVRGAKVSRVDIDMPDWQIDEVGPDSIVAVDGVPAGPTGASLSLPLVMPTIGQFEIRLKAHRPLPAAAKSLLSLPLPQPQVGAPVAAVVAVVPADNVEIIPDSQATTGLLRQQAVVPMELPARQQEPLFYRSDSPVALFVAELRHHKQKITVAVNSRVTIDPAAVRVEQKFAYSIAYESTDSFFLEVPRELGGKGRLSITYEGQPLSSVLPDDEAGDGAKPLRMRVALPKACIGPCEIAARYALTAPTAASDGNIHVPLVMPLEAGLTGNDATVAAGAEQQVEVVPGPWTAVEHELSPSAAPRTRELVAGQRTAEVAVRLRGETGAEAAVAVDRAWIQTCLTKSPNGSRRSVPCCSSPRGGENSRSRCRKAPSATKPRSSSMIRPSPSVRGASALSSCPCPPLPNPRLAC